MDADERDIFQFLKSWGSNYLAAREICRRAGGSQRFNEEPEWAKPILLRMEGARHSGIRCHRTIPHQARSEGQRHRRDKPRVSPDIAKILKESGAETEQATGGDSGLGPDEYYDQL